MRTKHVFFDLDRTLWDFEKNSESALQIIFDELKLNDHLDSFETFHAAYKDVNSEWWNKYRYGKVSKDDLRIGRFIDALARFDINSAEMASQLSDRYVEVSPQQTNLFPHTIETLKDLKSNNYALHIITNGFKEVQFVKLRNSKLIEFFDDILCSEEVGVNKPDPLVFKSALERTKAKSNESMMIGDDFEADILGAEKCGIRAVLFDPHNHFRQNNEVRKIQSLREVPPIVVGL
jgi:putative hydrolase of the HAD superfamily